MIDSEPKLLNLSVAELASLIEALHDAILRRLRWCVSPDFQHWRNLEIETVQAVMNSLVSTYTKAMMVWGESDFYKSKMFEDTFTMSDEIWDLLADITKATDWNGVPYHENHLRDCDFCFEIAQKRP